MRLHNLIYYNNLIKNFDKKMPRRNRDIVPILNGIKRRNTKCKRSKHIIKKCYELSVLCGLKINVQIYDHRKKRISEIYTDPSFDHDQIVSMR